MATLPSLNPLPQVSPSSYTWADLFDMQRRLGAASVNVLPQDILQITRTVSAKAYTYALWPFTLKTTALGSIQCINGQQDYPQPSDLSRLSRAWLYIPTQNGASGPLNASNTVPPYDDPSVLALDVAEASALYTQSLAPTGYPAGLIWPPDGSLNLVKRLPVNLYQRGYTAQTAITQQPNQNLLRLSSATYVPVNQPYSLELEYQPSRPPVNAMTENCWFPDDYLSMGQAGILYYLMYFNNDPRAGTSSFQSNGTIAYSGQLAVWMGSMEAAAAAERAGSVDTIVPSSSLGADTYNSWGTW